MSGGEVGEAGIFEEALAPREVNAPQDGKDNEEDRTPKEGEARKPFFIC